MSEGRLVFVTVKSEQDIVAVSAIGDAWSEASLTAEGRSMLADGSLQPLLDAASLGYLRTAPTCDPLLSKESDDAELGCAAIGILVGIINPLAGGVLGLACLTAVKKRCIIDDSCDDEDGGGDGNAGGGGGGEGNS